MLVLVLPHDVDVFQWNGEACFIREYNFDRRTSWWRYMNSSLMLQKYCLSFLRDASSTSSFSTCSDFPSGPSPR